MIMMPIWFNEVEQTLHGGFSLRSVFPLESTDVAARKSALFNKQLFATSSRLIKILFQLPSDLFSTTSQLCRTEEVERKGRIYKYSIGTDRIVIKPLHRFKAHEFGEPRIKACRLD